MTLVVVKDREMEETPATAKARWKTASSPAGCWEFLKILNFALQFKFDLILKRWPYTTTSGQGPLFYVLPHVPLLIRCHLFIVYSWMRLESMDQNSPPLFTLWFKQSKKKKKSSCVISLLSVNLVPMKQFQTFIHPSARLYAVCAALGSGPTPDRKHNL